MSDEETGDGASFGKVFSAGHKVIKAAESLYNSGEGIVGRLRDYSVQSREEGRQELTPELEGDVNAIVDTTKATIAVAGVVHPAAQSASLVGNTVVEVVSKDGKARKTIAHAAGAGVEVGDALVDKVKGDVEEGVEALKAIASGKAPTLSDIIIGENFAPDRQMIALFRIANSILGFLSPGSKKDDNQQTR